MVADASSFASLHGGASPTASGASDEDVTVADAAELPGAAADVDAAPSKEADGDADDDDEIVCEGCSELVLGLASLLSLSSEPESLSRSSALTPPMLQTKPLSIKDKVDSITICLQLSSFIKRHEFVITCVYLY